jgi:LPXTG-motif cell wall-anchored protein
VRRAAPVAKPPPARGAAPAPAPAPKPVAAPAGAGSVTIRDFSFGPASVTVTAGDTVSWTNSGPSQHTATGSGFDTGTLSKGQTGSHRFAQAGTFSYVCSIHPNMKGSVKVVAASSGGSGSGSGSGSSGSSGSSTAAPSGTGSGGGSSGTPVAPSAAGPQLPNTGADAGGMLMVGLGLAGLGAALRRRASA